MFSKKGTVRPGVFDLSVTGLKRVKLKKDIKKKQERMTALINDVDRTIRKHHLPVVAVISVLEQLIQVYNAHALNRTLLEPKQEQEEKKD